MTKEELKLKRYFEEEIKEFEQSPAWDRDEQSIEAYEINKFMLELLEHKLPEPELYEKPCEDAISRKAMLDYQQYLHGKMSNEENYKLWEFIKDLPPVIPTQKWIPCSEDLPKEAFSCFVTIEEDDIHGEPQKVIYPNFVGYDGETWNDADGKVIPFDVIAWMPTPKPYETEKENTKPEVEDEIER